ncbi:DUF488 family protein [Gilvimarinus sp. SDUM040013]|uniref:DUF488 family protein n=1 Tax=Gilvimarinus gilvus TaxID=3058038 RepID=A0ABU4RUI2_9GAMM|nr:DUF488 family protein [Gilvimarinus sp. SDUM040013]MDO3388598.1 DUF488 family protein [Gilvimarinus sp. SDUM040013]MDX6848530.1 DUF488 family protein [Gilvimarinus sp. SDUM040013]
MQRIYQDAAPADGTRILADRLWPRGKRKDELALAEWCRDAAPSTGIRQCWHRNELTEAAFGHAYRHQLDQSPECLVPLMRAARQGSLTLLTASKEPENSHLPILRRAILDALHAEDNGDRDDPASPVCFRS